MKLWVDDIRTPPDDTWVWCKTLDAARIRLWNCEARGEVIEEMSLDHDLGGDDTSRELVLFMCEKDFWPVEVRVHSANPVGVEWLEGMIERYKP